MRPHIFTIIFSPLVFFILLFLYVKLAGPIPFSVNSINTNKTDAFQVTGEGKASIVPDLITVTVGVSSQGTTSKQVQDQMNQTINKVTEALKALAVDSKDIQTQNYLVNPTRDFTSGQQKITGYEASTNLIIKVHKVDLANKVLDSATQNGATQVGGLNFGNTDKTKAEDKARSKAVAEAKKKAANAAKIAGFKLGKIINYSENMDGIPIPVPLRATGATDDSTKTQVEPGTNEVTVDVTLSYQIE